MGQGEQAEAPGEVTGLVPHLEDTGQVDSVMSA
jgi:hypothetical protein